MRRMKIVILSLFISAISAPAFAQADQTSVTPAQPETDDLVSGRDIIVTAPRIKGSVDTALPLELVLDEKAIASYGASSIADLLASLGNQTQSTRSRGGGGFPVVLLNGRRISGFQEMRDIPPEAIRRVEVLPEDVALRYGYPPGQRVVNFILKDDFAAISGEIEQGGPTSGGRSETQVQTSYLKISPKGRINLSAQVDRNTALTEAERHIVPAGLDQSGVRTLLPLSRTLGLNGTISRAISSAVNATFNVKYDAGTTHGALGLPLALITNPAATPYDVLGRDGKTSTLHTGTTVDGSIGLWRWTITGGYDEARSRTFTDRNFSDPALLGVLRQDLARSSSRTANSVATLNGPLLRLPAGPAMLGLRAGYEHMRFNSFADTSAGVVQGSLGRNKSDARASLDVPLTRRDEGLGRVIGQFALNGNYATADLSDFGGLHSYGYGFSWSPVEGLSLFGSVNAAQAAPTPQQLGDPRIVTSNVTVYDYLQGTTVTASLISGGNAALRQEEQRDKSLTLSYSPPTLKGLTLSGTYTAKRSDDLLSAFPALTVDTERAFADRILRDGAGRLISIDQRPINILRGRDDVLRWGVAFAKEFGQATGGGMGGFGRGAGGPRPPGAPGGGGRGPGGFGPMGGNGGRWSAALYHSIRFNDDIAFGAGLPLLDRLNGGATGSNGGTPRNQLDLEGGWFNKGMGFRLIGAWKQGTRVEGGASASDLFFSDVATLNLRFFVNFDQRKSLVKAVPFLKGSRIALRFDNITNDVITVRDETGLHPLRYQRGYLDPLGRTVEISFRKLF